MEGSTIYHSFEQNSHWLKLGLITLLIPVFVQKFQIDPPIFLSFNLIPIFKNYCNLILFVKFLEMDQKSFIKIEE